nr:unknown [Bacillus subtilis]
MADVLRRAINHQKQFLKTKLLLSEFYQGRGEQLADYTLSELRERIQVPSENEKKRSDNRYKEVSLLKSGLFLF